ncbi:MAG: PLP-dependent aminotransferase family protein [Phenylobacterium sp.]|uniref:aminotransferase-like domain-containing protein n=1 Tax=Phenylobacterium sp. TaxID=1871053 RepID=UPI001A4F20F3|nr:PLP-dependent aminotransferase family protein [Phenylobacterium sp.]MBL8554154.1 PLP-dependent aminotransferase family protein [Phenylobacterium sp.]
MDSVTHPSARWLARLPQGRGPLHARLVEALEAAIRDGELQAGDQLPPQRAVAGRLGVDLTTVTRAYAAARARGLIEGTVGRGTFVRARAAEDDAGLIDLSMNLPPPPQGLSLAGLIGETMAAVLDRADAATLMSYHPGGGSLGQRTSAAAWLAPVLGEVAPERVLLTPGAQTGLAAVLAAIAGTGVRTLVMEPLVYPGVLTAAAQFGLEVAVCPADPGGPDPEALARLCAGRGPAALYVTPTTNNPTAVTMDPARRGALAEVARRADLWIVEDDPYARLFDRPPPAVATLAPERTFHLATLSKCLSPGLRTAFLVPPEPMAARTAEALRALALMPSPLVSAVVSAWIREGTAERLLAAVRREARARRAIAAEVLPEARGAAEGVHVWLDLPPDWRAHRVHSLAQEKGLALVTADAFAAGPDHGNGLRISLGGPGKQAVLRSALEGVAALVSAAPSVRTVV